MGWRCRDNKGVGKCCGSEKEAWKEGLWCDIWTEEGRQWVVVVLVVGPGSTEVHREEKDIEQEWDKQRDEENRWDYKENGIWRRSTQMHELLGDV